ncbi:MAG TPA: efflux RND transporter permease subunit [Kofleriaceae bacterium]|nr:efflux RND transporter permease subunit [Kofleriaceae bacterium]
MKIADIAIRRPVFAFMVLMVPIVFGLLAYPRIGVEELPSVEFPVVTVLAVYPGADPSSMETKVAKPMEDALSSMGGIKRLQTFSLESLTQVVIEFQLDVDADKAAQGVRDRIAAIPNLPRELETPKIQKFDIGAQPIMSLALSGTLSPRDLTKLAEDVVKQRLGQIKGVGNIDIVGGRPREIHVVIDPARLAARGLVPDDVATALAGQNLELPAGRITETGREVVVTTKGAFTSVQEIADAPIVVAGMTGASAQAVVRIGDVAAVHDDMSEARSHASVDGTPSLGLVIQKESGANLVNVARAVRAEIAEMSHLLADKGAKLTIIADDAPYIERSFHDVQFDLVLGAVLAVIIILGFLRDGRATFISALALPTSVIATVWFLSLLGFTFNEMTMLALSLSIGLLIDDAIVVIENIHRHLEQGKSPMRAAAEATGEIGLAVLATTSSIIAVFVPVAMMQGIIGRFFFQFGITVSVAVMLSMFVSFTLTPMLSARLLKLHRGRPGLVSRMIERVLVLLERIYKRVLGAALRHRALTVVLGGVVLFGSCALATRVKTEFLPDDDRSEFSVSLELPTGTALATTQNVAELLAGDLRTRGPGVVSTFVTIGRGSGAVNLAQIRVHLKPARERPFKQQAVMSWVREHYAPLATGGVKLTLGASGGVGGDDSRPIQLNLRARNMDELIKASEALAAELKKTPGFVDVDSSYRGGKPQIEITPDRASATTLGVPVAAIARTVRALVSRDKVTDFKEDADLYDVRLTLADPTQADFPTLANLMVRSNGGELVPLSSLVRLERGVGPTQIAREARMRQITVYAGLDGLVLGEATTKVEDLARRVVPASVDTEMSGTSQLMTESFGYMIVSLILAVLLVYMILAAQFESLIHPFTIMMSLPLAVVGAFGALFLAGQTFSIFAMIGLIMLMGLVTKNAILLVDFALKQKADGHSTHDALLIAGPIRLRPILMTTAAMILGMMPVALGLGEGGEGRAPMAVVVIGGLVTSTMLTLVVVPVVFSLIEGLRARLRRKRPPEMPLATLVDGAPDGRLDA